MWDLSTLVLLFTTALFLLGVGWFGSVPNPPIASDFATHAVNNSAVQTTLSTLNIPANTVTGLQLLTYEVVGTCLQNTGVNQNTPSLRVLLQGQLLYLGPNATVLATSAQSYFYRLSILISPFNNSILTLLTVSSLAFAPGGVGTGGPETVRSVTLSSAVFDPTVNTTITLAATNAIASLNYTTTVEMAQLRAN